MNISPTTSQGPGFGAHTPSHCRPVRAEDSELVEPHKLRWRSLIMTNKKLLRSTPDYVVLHSFGRVFRDFPENYDTFKLSDMTHKLHVFISHNWATPRRIKFMALVFHFNHRSASVAAAVAYVATILVVMWDSSAADLVSLENLYFKSHAGTGVCVATYWLCLLFWHDVKRLLCCHRGKRVFLDRCCIHQSDEDLKQQGIEHLDVFLQLSDKMLVVYSELYTKKLWTMYELATFLPKRGPNRLVVLPTFLIRCTIIAVPLVMLHCIWVQLLLYQSVEEQVSAVLPDSRILVALLDLPLLVTVTWAFRTWSKEERQMMENVRTFHYGDSHCLKETDRTMVYGNIARYMRDTKAVPRDASDEDALQAFNQLVKAEVPYAITRSLGGLGIPLRYLFVILMPVMTNILDYMAASPLLYPERLAMLVRATGLLDFALSALVSATFLVWLTKRHLDLTGWKQCCWILSCSIIHVVPVGIVFAIVESLQVYAYDGVVWAVCSLLFVLVAQLLLLVLVHCRWRGEKRVCDKRSLYAYRVRFALSAVVRESQQLEATAENVEEESPRSLNFDSVMSLRSTTTKATSYITETRM
ncbi:unnamed protein product [Effrenium voratum]|nr:unnamed protein product [Effrenium voratum]|mmetsp:Transcript_133009/g.315245  ORF Transcript_133009/g.315245 Transcript_133009/m.315245 type:complete len:584 (-) Transcript_133009:310-2061(-)